ncbi:MAG: OmpH family outer membrane protein [Bacteroidetes bacterium]|nr:OmpH family outer membrane protein [Bacteroidota bacterium]
MNNSTLKKTIFALAAIGSLTFAKAQKIAHISLDSLVSVMPETKTAKDAAQTYYKGIENESISMQSELETKYQKYMQEEATMSEVVKKNKQEELNQLQRRIEDFKMQAQQDYQKKSAELTAPIMEKAKKGIEAVAKEGGYKYVLDTSVGNVLYSEAADDIFAAVKKKLDSMPLATIPGAMQTGGVKDPKKPVNNTPPKGR